MKKLLSALLILVLLGLNPQAQAAYSQTKLLMTSGAAALSAPVNTVAPVASGYVLTGQTLTSTVGSWSGNPAPSYTYQWNLAGSNISGATSSSFVVTSGEAAGPITVTVTASNSQGSASATSNSLAAFTPNALSPILWLDASNAGSITSSGGSVSQWNDLSGNGNNAIQANAARKPVTGTRTVNGKNCLDFDGANDGFGFSSALWTFPASNSTAFFVGQKDTNAVGNSYLFHGFPPGGSFVELRMGTNGTVLSYVNATSFSFANLTTAADTAVTHIWGGYWNGTGQYAFRDGVPSTLATGQGSVGTLTDFILGADVFYGQAYDGPVCEFAIFPTDLTTAQKNIMNAYINAKWGTSAVNF